MSQNNDFDRYDLFPQFEKEKLSFEGFLQYVENVLKGERRMSYSSMKKFREGGPFGFMMGRRKEFKETDALVLGRLTEDLIFDPDSVKEKYVIWEGRRAGNEYKALLQDATVNKRTVIKPDMMQKALFYRSRIFGNPEARDIIFSTNETQRELKFNICGIKHIGYSDAEGKRGHVDFVADLKLVTSKSGLRQLEWEIRDRWFTAQAALYTIGRENIKFYLIVLMQGGRCEVFNVTPQTREVAMKEYVSYLNQWKEVAEYGRVFEEVWWRGPEYLRPKEDKILML